MSTYPGGGVLPAIIDESMGYSSFMYLLEERTGYIRAVSPKDEQLEDALMDFFPNEYLDKYAQLKGGMKYEDLPGLVNEYNSL